MARRTFRGLAALGAAFVAAGLAGCGSDSGGKKGDATSEPEGDATGDAAGDAVTEPEGDADGGPVGDPGALIRTTATGTVGVLLDEVPESERDRVAAAVAARAEEFWKEHARRQLELTQYRLTFRQYYYEEEEAKGQLNLPPPQVWRFTLAEEGPKRTTVGGHDVVAVDYSFESEILADPATVADSDTALVDVGGTASEAFVLPVDPELVMQRTGYACIDEAEFPPNSADAESVATYFDDLCEVEDAPSKEGCHSTLPLPTESCVEALDAKVGSVDVELVFERIAWDPAVADQVRVGEWTSEVGADIIPIGSALENHRVVYKYIPEDDCAVVEGCVFGSGWRRLLRFDAFFKNIGKEPMHIGDVDYFIDADDGSTTELGQAGVFEYSACHDHYHFKYYGDFTFTAAGKETLGLKRAFCLETGTRHFNNEETSMTSPYAGCDYQGLTPGWGDEYGASLDCQWIDVTEVDTSGGAVTGDLGFEANPFGMLCEGVPGLDESGMQEFVSSEFTTEDGKPVLRPVCEYSPDWDANNFEERPATLQETGGFVTEPCTRGQIGPLRDCGFSEADSDGCTAGASFTLSCKLAAEGPPQVVRACEASAVLQTGTACIFQDALANVVVGTEATDLSFTCPAARDANEPGGLYTLYSAPLVEEDAAAPIACTLK